MSHIYMKDITDKVDFFTKRTMENLGIPQDRTEEVRKIVFDDLCDRLDYAIDELPHPSDYDYIDELVGNLIET